MDGDGLLLRQGYDFRSIFVVGFGNFGILIFFFFFLIFVLIILNKLNFDVA